MRKLIVTLFAVALPVVGRAQPSVEPLRPMAGTTLRVRQIQCAPPNSPSIILDQLELPAVGSGSEWSTTLPPTVEAKVYSLRWRCGTADSKDTLQIAAVDVLPLVPRVIAVSNLTRQTDAEHRYQLKDVVKLRVRNLKAWRQIPANNGVALRLFMAGTELRNVTVIPTGVDPTDLSDVSAVKASLEVDDTTGPTRKAWVQVLQAALRRDAESIEVSIGPEGAAPFPSDATVSLAVFPWYTWLVVAGLAVLVAILVILGKRSSILRDSNGASNPPYSLAKHQMALWFLVVVGSYLYVWLLTGLFSSISSTALIVIGVSGATGLAAVTLDNSKRQEAERTRALLQAENDALEDGVNNPLTGLRTQLKAVAPGSEESGRLNATFSQKLARLEEVKAALRKPLLPPGANRQWYLDLLSDESGVSFHRLQMAVWTVVLVLVFVRAVYADLLMPDFDSTLLGLMGISSGTYLGFKFPERKP